MQTQKIDLVLTGKSQKALRSDFQNARKKRKKDLFWPKYFSLKEGKMEEGKPGSAVFLAVQRCIRFISDLFPLTLACHMLSISI